MGGLRGRLTVAIVLSILAAVPVQAQDYWGGLSGGVRGMYGALADLLLVIILLGGLISVVGIAVHMMNGDRDSARRWFAWFAGLCFGFIMLAILRR